MGKTKATKPAVPEEKRQCPYCGLIIPASKYQQHLIDSTKAGFFQITEHLVTPSGRWIRCLLCGNRHCVEVFMTQQAYDDAQTYNYALLKGEVYRARQDEQPRVFRHGKWFTFVTNPQGKTNIQGWIQGLPSDDSDRNLENSKTLND